VNVYNKGVLRSWVEISRQQIAENHRAIKTVAGTEVMPVVKADAYNHGAIEVSRILVAEGVHRLAVASAEEGIALRQAGIEVEILLMADFLHDERDAIVDYNLTPVLHSIQHIGDLDDLAAKAQRCLGYHLKIDTGLSRLGMQATCQEILSAVQSSSNTTLRGVMTHLASAEDFISAQTDNQISAFLSTIDGLSSGEVKPPFIHLSSTNAIAYGRRQAWQNLVRPGLSIYGYVSHAFGDPREQLLQVKPALTWKSAVLAVKDLPEGTLVGYNGTFRTARPTRTAVLATGYADGYPQWLGNKGKVIVNGVLAPIIGAVSMDLITVDISDCPSVAPGGTVTLLGRQNGVSMDAQEIAALAGTIPYAILCNIGRRVSRQYVD
jgi:alanine racemase